MTIEEFRDAHLEKQVQNALTERSKQEKEDAKYEIGVHRNHIKLNSARKLKRKRLTPIVDRIEEVDYV